VILRSFVPADTPAVLALAGAEKLPGQPRPTSAMLADALGGRSSVDHAWWEELGQPSTDVAQDQHGGIVGAVSYALRPKDGTGVILWLHCREDPAVAGDLIAHACARLGHRPMEAFSFATALTLGLEALPVRHRPATHDALQEAGFGGERLWRYMHTHLPAKGLPLAPGLRIGPEESDPSARRLQVRQDQRMVAEAVIGCPLQGIGVLWWIGVMPDVRGRGLGRAMLGSALDALDSFGAREAIL
jgi:ribosomal protein S18 acetylase RimI-like enzyme